MWEMLLSQKKANLKISFTNIEASAESGKAEWTAKYVYGKRKVINTVKAAFKFKDGKIIQHTDTFDFWKWTRQALGTPGYLLGWTAFIKSTVQTTTNKKLDKFIELKPTS